MYFFFVFRLFGLSVAFVSSDKDVKEEIWVYPLLSFVSEFGGSLGLFLPSSAQAKASAEAGGT